MTTKMHPKVLVAAIAGIVILEAIALIQGINGAFLTIAVAAIAGLAGWSAPQLKLK